MWLRGIASRPLGFLLVVLLSTAACGIAALGPLLIRALEQATVSDAVIAAGAPGTQLTVSVRLEPGQPFGPAVTAVSGTYATVDQGGSRPLWEPVEVSVSSFTNLGWEAPSRSVSSRVVGTAAGCGEIVLTAGRCPARSGEVLVSAADEDVTGVAMGDQVVTSISDRRTPALTVVGSYDAARTMPGVLVRPDTPDGANAQVSGDPLVVTSDQLADLGQPTTVAATLRLAGTVGIGQLPAAHRTLDAVRTAAADGVVGRVLFFDSRLEPLLDEAQRRAYEGAVLVGVSVVQALAVAFFALGTVLQRLGQARSREWGLGRLRGIPPGRWLVSILLEPAVALLLGLPAGWGLAVITAKRVVAADLTAGTAVEPWRWPVLVLAAAGLVGGVLALAAVATRAVRRPPVELVQQNTEPRRLGLATTVAQVGLLLVAGLSVYQLVAADSLVHGGSRLGLLAPALAALSLALLAVRAAVLLVRRTTVQPPRTRVGLVVGRQLARTPSALTPAVVVAAAVASIVFATQVDALSTRNRDLLADATVGAPTVLKVAKPPTLDLIETVDAVDPTGRLAMAVQEKAASSDGGTSRIVAVDSSRFEAITAWSPSWSDAGPLASSLAAPARPIYLSGKEVIVALADVTTGVKRIPGFDSGFALEPPELSMTVETPLGNWFDVPLGTLATGTSEMRGELLERPQYDIVPFEPTPCLPRCRLVGLTVGQSQADLSSSFVVTGVATDRSAAAGSRAWLTESGWHSRTGNADSPPFQDGTLSATVTGSGLHVTVRDPYGHSQLTVVPGDTTDTLPTVLAPRAPTSPFPGKADVILGTGLDGQAQQLRVVGRAATLPRSLDDGVLIDLQNAQGSSPRLANEATSEVWLAAGAPLSVEQALESQGLRVIGRETLDQTRSALAREPTSRGATLSVTLGLAVLLLSVLALLAARLADATGRRASWLALRQAGIGWAAVRRLALVEVAIPALLAVVVGVVSGALILRLAAPRLPLRDTNAPGPPLVLEIAWGPLAVVGVGAVVLVGAAALAAALVETRRRAGAA